MPQQQGHAEANGAVTLGEVYLHEIFRVHLFFRKRREIVAGKDEILPFLWARLMATRVSRISARSFGFGAEEALREVGGRFGPWGFLCFLLRGLFAFGVFGGDSQRGLVLWSVPPGGEHFACGENHAGGCMSHDAGGNHGRPLIGAPDGGGEIFRLCIQTARVFEHHSPP